VVEHLFALTNRLKMMKLFHRNFQMNSGSKKIK